MSTLEVHFATRSEILTRPGINAMKTLVDNVRGHLSLLWMLRKQLIIGYKTQCANVPNVANAI